MMNDACEGVSTILELNAPEAILVLAVNPLAPNQSAVELGLCNLSLEHSLAHVVVAESSFG